MASAFGSSAFGTSPFASESDMNSKNRKRKLDEENSESDLSYLKDLDNHAENLATDRKRNKLDGLEIKQKVSEKKIETYSLQIKDYKKVLESLKIKQSQIQNKIEKIKELKRLELKTIEQNNDKISDLREELTDDED